MKKTAFITGILGQDGAWLAKHLLENDYEVYGGVRRTSTFNNWRLEFLGISDKVKLVEFDLLDYTNIYHAVTTIKPQEFYNLAAQSFVGTSFKQPVSTSMIDGMGVLYILDILNTYLPDTKFYQASTSEMFGKVQEIPQKETTPFYPRSPYGVSKLFAHWMTVNYRESYNLFSTSGILFNHESELRGPEFVTRKITMAAARQKKGSKEVLELGNLDAERDWGYAKEYVEGMHKILQANSPDTYVLATGVTTSIRNFVKKVYEVAEISVEIEGEGENEVIKNAKNGEVLVRVNNEFYRPAEVDLLIGDASKANTVLGWKAVTQWDKLAEIMFHSDLKLLNK